MTFNYWGVWNILMKKPHRIWNLMQKSCISQLLVQFCREWHIARFALKLFIIILNVIKSNVLYGPKVKKIRHKCWRCLLSLTIHSIVGWGFMGSCCSFIFICYQELLKIIQSLASVGEFPLNLLMEMRVTATSDVYLAPGGTNQTGSNDTGDSFFWLTIIPMQTSEFKIISKYIP